jgi:Ca2+/H+ antiporter
MTSSVIRLAWLTSIVPLAVGLRYLTPLPPLAAFVLGGLAVAVLAVWMRRATDQIAKRAGSAIGGLLNVSFGSAAELILMLFVVMSGHPEVVRAQITGSIIGKAPSCTRRPSRVSCLSRFRPCMDHTALTRLRPATLKFGEGSSC